jgi:class 3 adenylate cyclase
MVMTKPSSMTLTVEQAKRIVAVAPPGSVYYQEAVRVLLKGHYGVDGRESRLEGPETSL